MAVVFKGWYHALVVYHIFFDKSTNSAYTKSMDEFIYATTGMIYAPAVYNGQRIWFKFDHEPTPTEIDAELAKLAAADEAVYDVILEDGSHA